MSDYLKVVLIATLISLGACGEKPLQGECDVHLCAIDYAGVKIQLMRPAKRIAALAPHIVENVYSAGAGERLVAAFEYSNFPESAKDIPIVGSYQSINIERILELNPDLIIAWQSGNSEAAVSRLKELGFTVYIDEPTTVADVAKSVNDIAKLTATISLAAPKVNEFLSEVESLKERYNHEKPLRVFYQVWNSPLQTINGNHVISNLIETCGGKNIYDDAQALAPIVNIESLIERNPDVIIAGSVNGGKPAWFEDWFQWSSIQAVKENHLLHVNPDHTQRHTLRLLLGMRAICSQLEEIRQG